MCLLLLLLLLLNASRRQEVADTVASMMAAASAWQTSQLHPLRLTTLNLCSLLSYEFSTACFLDDGKLVSLEDSFSLTPVTDARGPLGLPSESEAAASPLNPRESHGTV